MNKASFDWLRINHSDIKFFVHKLADEKEINSMLDGLSTRMVCGDGIYDDEYHIIATRSHTLMYRIRNEVYIIPATVNPTRTAIVDNKYGKNLIMALYFDYPCEMKREDLVEY